MLPVPEWHVLLCTHHVEGLLQRYLPKAREPVGADLQLLWRAIWVPLQSLQHIVQYTFCVPPSGLWTAFRSLLHGHCRITSTIAASSCSMLGCLQWLCAAVCLNACAPAHLGKCAGALVLDLVVADVHLHQLLVGVLLQRPGQLDAARVTLRGPNSVLLVGRADCSTSHTAGARCSACRAALKVLEHPA